MSLEVHFRQPRRCHVGKHTSQHCCLSRRSSTLSGVIRQSVHRRSKLLSNRGHNCSCGTKTVEMLMQYRARNGICQTEVVQVFRDDKVHPPLLADPAFVSRRSASTHVILRMVTLTCCWRAVFKVLTGKFFFYAGKPKLAHSRSSSHGYRRPRRKTSGSCHNGRCQRIKARLR